MTSNAKSMISYFRSAIAAQLNNNIDFKKTEDYKIISSSELEQGVIQEAAAIFEEINKPLGKKKEKIVSLQVIIAAKTLQTIISDAQKTDENAEELMGIFFIPAILNIDGTLSFDAENKRIPWFPRELLDPILEVPIAIGKAVDFDTCLEEQMGLLHKIESWEDYKTYYKRIFKDVCKAEFSSDSIPNLQTNGDCRLDKNMYLFEDSTVNASFHIQALNNILLEDELAESPLMENFLDNGKRPLRALVENISEKMSDHLGQMSGEYALSPSQREAINHFTSMKAGEILAVNGPPGTGKTTLLQSIVANLFVEHALKRDLPPVIFAASTNNQAVTNIIESFGSVKAAGIQFLEKRWVKQVTSFATYLPKASALDDSEKKGFQCTTQRGENFVENIDSETNIEQSTEYFLQQFNGYFQSNVKEISACQTFLWTRMNKLREEKNTLLNFFDTLKQYEMDGLTLYPYIQKISNLVDKKKNEIMTCGTRSNEWKAHFRTIPFFYRLFHRISFCAKRISAECQLFRNADESFLAEPFHLNDILNAYADRKRLLEQQLRELREKSAQFERKKEELENSVANLKTWGVDLEKASEELSALSLDDFNQLLDTKLRYVLFWLAVHYYESRWLQGECSLSEKQKGTNYPNVIKNFYHRLCMLTPCLVSTFYMLPKHLQVYDKPNKTYLFNYIDLLIVDEAGQVSPEVAAPSFSLAKKALVVGDVHQIAPVWGIANALDKSLAIEKGVIANAAKFDILQKSGLNCSESSVMAVASNRCDYQRYSEQRGLFLSEHRRCYDEIISYCNELVYGGKLQPLRGSGSSNKTRSMPQWPQMGHIEVATSKSKRSGTSRINLQEADAVAKWISRHYEGIRRAFPNDSQQELIGVITPFKAQVTCIKRALARISSHTGEITVGTIHTFQGAERRIILMSTVYGAEDGCFFIDKNKSLMNVAVSRAKDHFFVFGSMDCLQNGKTSASGLLKKSLLPLK